MMSMNPFAAGSDVSADTNTTVNTAEENNLSTETSGQGGASADPGVETTTETTGGELGGTFLDQFKELTGMDLAAKYTDEQEAMKGLAEAARMVGRRAEDTEQLQQLRQLIRGREEEFSQLLRDFATGNATSPKTTPAPTAATPDDLPKTYEELRLLEAELFDNGQLKPGADRQKLRTVQKASQKMQQIAYALATDPVKALAPVLEHIKGELLKESEKTTQNMLSQQTVAGQWENLARQHENILFVEGDRQKLTPFAKDVNAEYEELIGIGAPDSPKTYQKAIANVQARVAKPNPTKPINARAVRQPAIAPPKDKTQGIGERIEKEGDAAILDILIEGLTKNQK